jgi:hypothetical protein
MSDTTFEAATLQLRRGDHVCVFTRGNDERDDLLVPFLTDGLGAGHKCLAILDTSEPGDLLDAIGSAAAAAHPADQLMVLASRDVYLTEDRFDIEGMLHFYDGELRQVATGASAYACIRTAGEMTWALRDIPGVEDLLSYEARVNEVLASHPQAAISLCMYDVDRFNGEMIVGVLRTHPKMVVSGTVVDNPFFIPPDEFMRLRN